VNFDNDAYEIDKYLLDLHESILNLSAGIGALCGILAVRGIVPKKEFYKIQKEIKQQQFGDVVQLINDRRDLIAKYESEEKDPIEDLLADLFNKE
jgi:hypothetical protein